MESGISCLSGEVTATTTALRDKIVVCGFQPKRRQRRENLSGLPVGLHSGLGQGHAEDPGQCRSHRGIYVSGVVPTVYAIFHNFVLFVRH